MQMASMHGFLALLLPHLTLLAGWLLLPSLAGGLQRTFTSGQPGHSHKHCL